MAAPQKKMLLLILFVSQLTRELNPGCLGVNRKHYLSAMPPYSQRVYWSVLLEALRVICYVFEAFIALPFCQLKRNQTKVMKAQNNDRPTPHQVEQEGPVAMQKSF